MLFVYKYTVRTNWYLFISMVYQTAHERENNESDRFCIATDRVVKMFIALSPHVVFILKHVFFQ
jgi:hypothetical protein